MAVETGLQTLVVVRRHFGQSLSGKRTDGRLETIWTGSGHVAIGMLRLAESHSQDAPGVSTRDSRYAILKQPIPVIRPGDIVSAGSGYVYRVEYVYSYRRTLQIFMYDFAAEGLPGQ